MLVEVRECIFFRISIRYSNFEVIQMEYLEEVQIQS